MSGQLADAERLYREVLASDPLHAPALHHLGLLAHQAGRHSAALSLIERALDLNPDYAEAHCNRGLVLLALQNTDKSIVAFERAIRLAPRYLHALYNLGVAWDAKDDPAQALTWYDVVLHLAPDHVDARCNRAIALHALGRLTEAIEAYRGVLEDAPHLKRLHAYCGAALLELGHSGPGVEALRKAMALTPEDPAVPFLLSEFQARAGDVLSANAYLQQALRHLVAKGALTMPDVPPQRGSRSIGQFPEALRAVLACMAAAGIEVYLTSGTLLGAIRDGDFIGFDKDIDLGVSAKVPLAKIHRALGADPDFTTEASLEESRGIYWTRWSGRILIDFFRFHESRDHTWYEFYYGGQIMKWVHRRFGLVDFDWHGVPVLIPENSELFLEEVYGRNWRIPDPDFPQWACPNLAGGYSFSCRHMALKDVFIALWRGQVTRARNQCLHALALDPDDTFFHELLGEFNRVRPVGQAEHWLPSVLNTAVERLARNMYQA